MLALHVQLEATAELANQRARLVQQGRTIPPQEALHQPLALHVLRGRTIPPQEAIHLMLALHVQLEAIAELANQPAHPVLQGRTIPPRYLQIARYVLQGRTIPSPVALHLMLA
jgi:hypothetical protein